MGVICILLLVNLELTGDKLNGGDEGSEQNGSKNMFVPVAFETLGPICSDGVNLIALIGEKLTSKSGDGRERMFLFQRLSVAIQRGNAAAFHGTFKSVDS